MNPQNNRFGQDITLDCRRIRPSLMHTLRDFSCGNDTLDTFFKEKAADSEREVTYLFIDTATNRTAAAVSLSCSALLIGENNFINESVPSVEITYFGVDREYQKMQYSEVREDGYFSDMIMDSVIQIISDFSVEHCGATYILLFSTPEAVHFYQRNRFVRAEAELIMQRNTRFLEGCIQMYLEL